MRRQGSLTLGVVLGALMFFACPSAFGAPSKHQKSKHPATPAADSAPPAHGDDAESLPDATAAVKARDEPAVTAEPKSEPATTAPVTSPIMREGAAKASPDASDTTEQEALGRREAARLAAGRSEVGISASAGIGSRRFTYSDAVGTLPAAYRLSVAPMADFGLEAYPLASSDLPGLRDLGFRGHISRAFALDSATPQGVTIRTSWTRFGGELRERVLVSGSHPLELGLDLGAEASYFVMSTETKVLALLPSARTISIRVGVDARLFVAWRLSLLLGAAYLSTTSRGEIYDQFRDPHVAGVDGAFGGAVALTPGLEARLIGSYTRYFASFKPKLGDAIVAGGALDEQLQLGLGLRYAH